MVTCFVLVKKVGGCRDALFCNRPRMACGCGGSDATVAPLAEGKKVYAVYRLWPIDLNSHEKGEGVLQTRQMRWLEKLNDFMFEVVYLPGDREQSG